MWLGFNHNYFINHCILEHLSYEEFCVKHNIDYEIINKFLQNSIDLTIKEIIEIASVLNTSIKNLFMEENLYNKDLIFC